ncbi:transcription termination factor NusA, partial [Salmonella enterica subsp. enterica serovar Infantis]
MAELLSGLFRFDGRDLGVGVWVIKAAARVPGSRARIAVKPSEKRGDPVGGGVGMRGARGRAGCA